VGLAQPAGAVGQHRETGAGLRPLGLARIWAYGDHAAELVRGFGDGARAYFLARREGISTACSLGTVALDRIMDVTFFLIMVAFTEKKQGLHDLLASTVVRR
jgi:uncharacterized RDD family membrane protein YckC